MLGKRDIYRLFGVNSKKDFDSLITDEIISFDESKYNEKLSKSKAEFYYKCITKTKDFDYLEFPPAKAWEDSGYTDMTIYDRPYYKLDTLACFHMFTYSNMMEAIKSLSNNPKAIADYGGGIGLSTLLLAMNFPNSNVYLIDYQSDFFTSIISKFYITKKLPNIQTGIAIPDDVDTVFMMEFLEHLPDPISFIRQEIFSRNIKFIIMSNTFSKMGMGHFLAYPLDGKQVPGNRFSRYFNAIIKTEYNLIFKPFSGRPQIYRRK